MAIKLSKEEFISLVANSILKVLVSIKSDPEFVKQAKDRDLLSIDSTKENEFVTKGTNETEREIIILIDE